jgi:transcriptional regulator with XRE-family HTH domain
MSFYSQDELLRDETYWTTKIQLELFRQIEAYLEKNELTRSDFAKQLGVSKGYVSQVLNGTYDHKLSKLVGLCLAMNKVPLIEFQDVNKVVHQITQEQKNHGSRHPYTASQSVKVFGTEKPIYHSEDQDKSAVIFPLAA